MKKLLIVVDYQNDFVTGTLGFPQAEGIATAIAAKIREYRANGDEIAFTMDTHGKDYLETHEGKNLPVLHCVENTSGWMLHDSIARLVADKDRIFCKSAFGSAELFDYLKEKSYESVELAGVIVNICVMANAALVKSALPEAPVIVDAGCVAGNDPALERKALDVMESMHIKILNKPL